MGFQQPELPYAPGGLQPFLSELQMSYHYGKHHAAYFKNLNALVEGKPQAQLPLRQLVVESDGGVFNNAAQAWNHGFFWESMSPSPGKPSGALSEAIEAFGGLPALKEKFVETGVGQFGSGWAWLLWKDGKIAVAPSHDADNPLANGSGFPLLVCDVWEHAYYLDHQNDRKGFLTAWFDTLANWAFAGRQLAAAQGSDQGYKYPPPR